MECYSVLTLRCEPLDMKITLLLESILFSNTSIVGAPPIIKEKWGREVGPSKIKSLGGWGYEIFC